MYVNLRVLFVGFSHQQVASKLYSNRRQNKIYRIDGRVHSEEFESQWHIRPGTRRERSRWLALSRPPHQQLLTHVESTIEMAPLDVQLLLRTVTHQPLLHRSLYTSGRSGCLVNSPRILPNALPQVLASILVSCLAPLRTTLLLVPPTTTDHPLDPTLYDHSFSRALL